MFCKKKTFNLKQIKLFFKAAANMSMTEKYFQGKCQICPKIFGGQSFT